MNIEAQVSFDNEEIARFCRERHIRRLSVFGSALRSDFRADSDIDLLVEFIPGHTAGLFGIARMEGELSALLGGRKADLRTPEDVSRYFREELVEQAEVACEWRHAHP